MRWFRAWIDPLSRVDGFRPGFLFRMHHNSRKRFWQASGEARPRGLNEEGHLEIGANCQQRRTMSQGFQDCVSRRPNLDNIYITRAREGQGRKITIKNQSLSVHSYFTEKRVSTDPNLARERSQTRPQNRHACGPRRVFRLLGLLPSSRMRQNSAQGFWQACWEGKESAVRQIYIGVRMIP
jgi:hypothetical protein